MTTVPSQQIWRGFHWSFFIDIQGLLICLQRFESQLAQGRLAQAQTELETAETLMLASGAAMELCGSFSRDDYERQVRPSMMPPHVQSDDFSGLMSWEHAALMHVWKHMRRIFQRLPAALQPQHKRFVKAYLSLAKSHRAVCEKFGGAEGGSLHYERTSAVETLDKFRQSRHSWIDPVHHVNAPDATR
jgi:hypothetical protein